MKINNSWEIEDHLIGLKIKAVKDKNGGHLIITRIDDDPLIEEREYHFDTTGNHTISMNTGGKP